MTRRSIALLMLSHWMKFLDHPDNCISDIRSWMITNKLKINDSKTEFLLITSPRSKFTKDIQITIGQSNISPSSTCKSLGVMLDDHFAMDANISNICRSTYFSHPEHWSDTWSSHSICRSPAGAFSCHLTCRLLQCSASWGTRLQNQTPTENA